jgi:hypothetical protein
MPFVLLCSEFACLLLLLLMMMMMIFFIFTRI